MTFSIMEEKEDELKVLLDCGDYFFKKQNKTIPNLVAILMVIFIIYLFNCNPCNMINSDYLIMTFYFFNIIGAIVYAIFYAKSNNKPVIFEITPSGIIVKSRSDFVKDLIWIEKLNIKSIYVQVEKLDAYPMHKERKEDIYTVILKTKKPIQLPKFEKDKILLYREYLTEKQYYNWLEPKLNKIKNMLKLSTKKNIKVVKQYDRKMKEIEKFW